MLLEWQHIVFVPVTVLVSVAVVSIVVALVGEWRGRVDAPPAAPVFRPVLVHDRGREMLLRSRRAGVTARPKIRLVYNGG
jgi:hypothetical protein